MSGTARQPEVRPIQRRQRWASIGLIVVLVLLGANILWDIVGIVIVGQVVIVPDEWIDVYDSITMVLLGVYFLAFIPTGVLFIMWQRSMTHNLLALGVRRVEPGVRLSTWSWFIPFANLYLPCVSMLQIARHSAPPSERPAGALVGSWWAAWLIGNVASWGSSGMFDLSETPRGWIAAVTADVISSALVILAGLLAIRMMSRLTRHQETRLRSVETLAPIAPAPPSSCIGRSGRLVVASHGASLPPRCVKCNAPVDAAPLERALRWHPPAVYLVLLSMCVAGLLGLIAYIVVACATARKATVFVGVCRTHRRTRVSHILTSTALCLGATALVIAGPLTGRWAPALAGLAVLVAGLIYAAIMVPVVRADRIDRTHVWIKGCCRRYLEELEAPGSTGSGATDASTAERWPSSDDSQRFSAVARG